jgi:hypothetical protein
MEKKAAAAAGNPNNPNGLADFKGPVVRPTNRDFSSRGLNLGPMMRK